MKNLELAVLLWTALGVVSAVLLPILTAWIRRDFPTQALPGIPPWAWRYLRLFAFSIFVAFICVAWWTNAHPDKKLDWSGAFLLGFGWEAALEKAMRPPTHSLAAPSKLSLWLAAGALGAALLIVVWAATGG